MPISIWLAHFEAMIEFALLDGIELILLGDFIIDLNLNNYESKK